MQFSKLQPRVMNYSDYKHFRNENLKKNLLLELSNVRNNDDGSTGFIET